MQTRKTHKVTHNFTPPSVRNLVSALKIPNYHRPTERPAVLLHSSIHCEASARHRSLNLRRNSCGVHLKIERAIRLLQRFGQVFRYVRFPKYVLHSFVVRFRFAIRQARLDQSSKLSSQKTIESPSPTEAKSPPSGLNKTLLISFC